MHTILLQLAAALGRRMGLALVIVAAAVGMRLLWTLVGEETLREGERRARVEAGRQEEKRLLAGRAELAGRLAEVRRDLAEQRERLRRAARVLAALEDASGWWQRWFGDPAQTATNAERRRRMEEMQAETRRRIAVTEALFGRLTREEGQAEQALGRVRRELAAAEAGQSPFWRRLEAAWTAVRVPVAATLALVFAGPTVWALGAYFVLGPWIARGRPLRLGPEAPVSPRIRAAGVALPWSIGPAERLWVKPEYLQSSEDVFRRRTRWLLDPGAPLTSLAAGWHELQELRPEGGRGGEVTLASREDPQQELAAVEVPAGESLVLSPRHVVGVLAAVDAPVRLRARWHLTTWQSWVGGRFRHFVWSGPCVLAVAGRRGIRAEALAGGVRRMQADLVIGHSLGVARRPVRAETFWSYYRGRHPLWEEQLAGRGLVLLEATGGPGAAAAARRWWERLGQGLLRVLGL
jgi:hypothetical protein